MQKSEKPVIVLTGGHAATPGIAVSETLKKRFPEAKLCWIGSKYTAPGSKATTLEYKILPEVGVRFYHLLVGKLQTKFTRYTIPLLVSIPFSFIHALWLVLTIRPKVIMSFGGFSSFPVIFWGWAFGVPIILHEQTVAVGRANLASAFFARKIAVARRESLSYFPKDKTVVTGNPLMQDILSIKVKQRPSSEKSILVIGGSRGSEFINEEVKKIIPQITENYKLIHVTGERDFQKYKTDETSRYKVLAMIDPRTQRKSLYENADLIISRSGANTVSEILFIKRPALLIPLPRTFMNEQYKNAKYAQEFGIAKVMTEKEITPNSLMNAIESIFSNWQKIVDRVKDKKSPDVSATEKIADLISGYL